MGNVITKVEARNRTIANEKISAYIPATPRSEHQSLWLDGLIQALPLVAMLVKQDIRTRLFAPSSLGSIAKQSEHQPWMRMMETALRESRSAVAVVLLAAACLCCLVN